MAKYRIVKEVYGDGKEYYSLQGYYWNDFIIPLFKYWRTIYSSEELERVKDHQKVLEKLAIANTLVSKEVIE